MNLDWHNVLGIGASFLLILLVVPYIRSIITSTTRPSAVSWFGWALLYGITTVAQASKGIDWSLAIPLISTFSTTIIACTALYMGRAVWTRADHFSIALAVIAIALWAITQEPLVAIILSIVADFAVTIPTVVKTYDDPKSEPALLWVLFVLGATMTLVATSQFTIYNLLFPVYSVLTSVVIMLLALRGHFISRV